MKKKISAQAASRAKDSDISIPVPEGLNYLPFQRAGIQYCSERRNALIGDAPGLGKQHPIYAKVLTPEGWKEIGSIKKGDFLIGSDGGPTTVLGIYPQGTKPVYRVVFSDHSSAEVGPEHLWSVFHKRGGKVWEELILTTDQLRLRPILKRKFDNGKTTQLDLKKTTLYLPMLSSPVRFMSSSPPIDGYLLGLAIGNGSCMDSSLGISMDARDVHQVHQKLQQTGHDVGQIEIIGGGGRFTVRKVIGKIRTIGLSVSSKLKRIPQFAFVASVPYRIDLLHGLMDSDGSISSKHNKIVYYTTSFGLAEDVQRLVEELGGIASINCYDRTAEQKSTEYSVRIRLPHNIKPFSTHRKSERFNPGRYSLPVRTVVAVEYVEEAESVCVAVDAKDKLYCTKHCILTHNTIQAVGVWNLDKSLKSCLIVCPASLRLNWQREFEKWSTRPVVVKIVNGGKPKDWPTGTWDVLIINYDVLTKHRSRIDGCQIDLLIGDEIQYCRSQTAQRTKGMFGYKTRKGEIKILPIKASRKLFLTGTPIVNRPVELWPLIESLDPLDLGRSFFKFALDFCAAKKTRWGWDFTGASKLDLLQKKLREKFMVRRLKEEVLNDLPAKIRQVIPIPAEGASVLIREELDAYEYMESLSGTERSRYAFETISDIRHRVALAKVPYVIEYVKDAIESSPVVLFAHHQDVIQLLKNAFPNCVTITGDTSMEERQLAVDTFQNGNVDLIIGNIQAMGVGLTLSRSSHVIFAELDWVPGNLSQAEDRCHRIGQTESVLVQHIVLEGSLDQKMLRDIFTKQEIIDKALDK
jgi:hypothetical protein